VVSILGISAFYHDSAACLVSDGEIVAAAQEERFTRIKHEHRFPVHAARYCLSEANLTARELDYVGFYDKPLLKFDRLLETYLDYSPRGFSSFLKSMPLWMSEKLWMPDLIRTELAKADGEEDERQAKKNGKKFEWKLLFGDHHESHAAITTRAMLQARFIHRRSRRPRYSRSTALASGPQARSARAKETS